MIKCCCYSCLWFFLNDNVVAAADDGYGVVGGDGYDSYDDRTHL